MDQELHEHYLQLWQLTESLRKDWWDDTEKARIKQLLKDAAAHDSSLSGLNPTDPDFFEDLSLKLSSLVNSRPEIPSSNMPSPDSLKQWGTQRKEHLDELKKKKDEISLIFLNQKGKLADIPQEETYLILKKHGLVDNKGNFNLSNASALIEAQEEIGLRIAYWRHFTQIRDAVITNLQDNHSPITLLMKQAFGDETPGLIDGVAGAIAKNTNTELNRSLRRNLSGQPISLSTPGLGRALSQTASSLKTTAVTRKLISEPELRAIVATFLVHSANFLLLEPTVKESVIDLITDAAYTVGTDPNLTPTEFEDFVVEKGKSGIVIKTTPISASGEIGEESAYQPVHTKPQNAAQWVTKQLNVPTAVGATKKMQKTLEGFAKDPTAAFLQYPLLSLVQTLPGPVKNLYFRNTGWQNTLKAIGEAYGVSVSPDAQRELLEGWLLQGIKAILKPTRLVNEKGQWIWWYGLGRVVDEGLNLIGEGLSFLGSKLPFVGNKLGKIISRRIGKDRKRDENYLAGIFGIVFDASLALLKILPQTAWKLFKKTPIFQKLRTSFVRNYVNLETRYGFFRTLRMASGIGKSFFRGVFSFNTLWGGWLGYAITGTPLGGMGGGFLGALYQGWVNISKDINLLRLLTRPTNVYLGTTGAGGKLVSAVKLPGDNFFDKSLKIIAKPGVFMAKHGWARVPFKGLLLGYLLLQAGVPLYYAVIPVVADWLWLTRGWWGGKLGQLFLGTRVGSGIARFTGPILSKLGFLGKIFNFLGKLLGGILGRIIFAIPFIPLLVDLLSGVSAGAALAHWFSGGLFSWGALGVGQIVFLIFLKGFIPALFGFSSIGAMVGAGFTALGAAMGGISAAAAAALALAIVALVAANILIAWNVGSAFFQQKAIHKGLINPRLNINKTLANVQKNSSNEVISLDYRITYTYTPKPGDPPGEIKITKIIDQFELGWIFPEFNIFKRSPDYNPSGFTCNPTDVVWSYQGIVSYFIWEKLDSSCPQLFLVSPGETKTLDIHLVFKDSWQKSKMLSKLNICNIPTVWANLPDGKPLDPPSSLPPLCVSPEGKVVTAPAAELAKKIINELMKCGINKVNSYTINQTEECLTKAKIPAVAIDEIKASVANYKGYFQCVGLIDAVEAATGGKFSGYDLGTAYLYWTNLPDYQQIDAGDYNNIAVGDILVWTSGSTGHMAMATNVVFDSTGKLVKVEIAEALGTLDEGGIRIRELPATDTGIDSPGLAGWQRRK